MAKKINKNQIADKDVFGNIAESAAKAEAIVKGLEITLKSVVSTAKQMKRAVNSKTPSNNSDIKERNALIRDSNVLLNEKQAAEKLLNKVKKDSILLEAKLKANRTKLSQENEVVKVQIQEEAKARKDLAKESLGLVSQYEKESKRLNDLRKEFKSLTLVEKKSTKETKRLAKEITKLDKKLKDVDEAAGQFQRNVGNYPESFGNAASSILGVAAAAISAKGAFEGVQDSLESTAEGSENVREVTSKISGVFDQVKNVVAGAALDVFDYGKAIVDVASGSKKGFAALGALTNGFKRTEEATKDFGDKVKESVDSQGELTKRIIEFEKAARPLEIRLTRLNRLIAEQAVIAGDSTRSFEQITAAILKGQDLQVKRANINVKLAKEELEITQERVRIANLAGGAGVELLDQETQAIRALIDAENDLKIEILENEKELRQVKQDRLEIDLDILIDGFDNQKTINERIIANEKETLEKRAKIYKDTERLASESFSAQKEVLQDLSSAGIDVDDLLLLDATELAKQIHLLEQSEIINTRTLEVIRERRLVLQDLEETQNELNESEQQAIDLRADIIAQEDALYTVITSNAESTNEALKKLSKDRLQNEIKSLERRLSKEKEGSLEYLQIQKDLNDKLLELNESNTKKEKEAKEVDYKNTIKALDLLDDIITKSIDRRIELLGKEEQARKDSLNEYKQAARDGNITAKESLAEEQALAEQAEKKQADLEQKKQNTLLVTAVLKAYASELDSGKTGGAALTAAITNTTVLTQFASALPAFIEGTEMVSKSLGKPQLSGQDGHIIRVDGRERILNPEQNKKIGNYTNEEVAQTMEQKRLGELGNDTVLIAQANGVDLTAMEVKLDEVKKAIQDIPENNIELAEITQHSFNIIQRKKKGNRTTVNTFKVQ